MPPLTPPITPPQTPPQTPPIEAATPNPSASEPPSIDDNMLNNSNLSAVLNQERDPVRLRTFFKEFSEAIRNNKRRDSSDEF